jgi:hypothetical protein
MLEMVIAIVDGGVHLCAHGIGQRCAAAIFAAFVGWSGFNRFFIRCMRDLEISSVILISASQQP